MAELALNTTYKAQPELLSQAWPWPFGTTYLQSALPTFLTGWSPWQYVVTFLLGVVVYDQVMYIVQKGSIAGPPFKIPLMGPFLQALDPKFEGYLAQWASGPLSCVSVFHKYGLSPIPIQCHPAKLLADTSLAL